MGLSSIGLSQDGVGEDGINQGSAEEAEEAPRHVRPGGKGQDLG